MPKKRKRKISKARVSKPRKLHRRAHRVRAVKRHHKVSRARAPRPRKAIKARRYHKERKRRKKEGAKRLHARIRPRKARRHVHRKRRVTRRPRHAAPKRRRPAKHAKRPAPQAPVPIHAADFIREIKSQIAKAVSSASGLDSGKIIPLLERPPEGIGADFALPCFTLARAMRKDPRLIALDLSHKIAPSGLIRAARPAGAYLNFSVDWNAVAAGLLPASHSGRYGSSRMGEGKAVLVDFSSPNIAKPMSVGHLRSTTIGDSLCRMHRFLGYRVIGDNHLGDWGTQFGKMIVAYRRWGHPERLEKSPVDEMLRLYVKFHGDAEADPKLEDEARLAFKRLEEGDREHLELWKKFSELSRAEFGKVYRLLGVRFDLQQGESFYDRMAKGVIDEAIRKGVAKWSQHALVIETGGEIPLIIRKSDEATLYSTRDLAAISYRMRRFRPERILYVVGSEQKSYLEQVFRAAEKLGYAKPGKGLVHVQFGMMSLPEGKMSTRRGRVVLLHHVISEVVDLAEKTIMIKNPELKGRKKVAQEVGIGALKYADLSRDRIKDVRFDWDEILSFEGDTGPYVQYTHARACSILRKGKIKAPPARFDSGLLKDPKEAALIRKLAEFPETVARAAEDCKPHYVANYVFSLATLFNEFYQSMPVLKAKKGVRESRVALVFSVMNVLKSGLSLLGIEAPEEM